MTVLNGTGVSRGIVSGTLAFYHREKNIIKSRTAENAEAELSRWKAASEKAAACLAELCEKARAEAGEEAASLFETHLLMLDDPDYTERITELIKNEHLCAEAAVSDAGREFAEMFAAMDDEYMQARSADVKDISSRVVNILAGRTEGLALEGKPVIIAADDLTPSETVQLDKSLVLGFILSGGSVNGHTAILAGTLGIPAAVGVKDILSPENEGKTVILDGNSGIVTVEPDENAAAEFERKKRAENDLRSSLEALKGKPDVTADGKEIKVYANITFPSDIDAVISCDAKGIGLFRSEFLYLESENYPTEEVQFNAYKTVVSKMEGKPVIIRTLDIGADKNIGYFDLAEEKNPALGMRALRICLTRPEVFRTQLRALYRASAYGKLSIMFPMVASLWEVKEAKRICEEVKAELRAEGVPFDQQLETGIMIETPAAVMMAAELAKEVSFFSIGTNDLTQYTIAVDRQGAPGLERFYDPHHPAVMKMIKMTVEAAHSAGIWAGICGEIASDTTFTEELLKTGADELSVSPRAVLPLRNAVRNSKVN